MSRQLSELQIALEILDDEISLCRDNGEIEHADRLRWAYNVFIKQADLEWVTYEKF